MRFQRHFPGILLLSLFPLACHLGQDAGGFAPLFPDDGIPAGWIVTDWSDVSNPPPPGAVWERRDGVLHGSTPRGTWLVSAREYGDFVLEFQFRLDRQGNSGCGLRFPMAGDPAFDGLELQLVDPRYYGPNPVAPDELTGAIYKAIAPSRQTFRPEAWNRCRIRCEGPRIVISISTAAESWMRTSTSKPNPSAAALPCAIGRAAVTSDFRNSAAAGATS